MDVAYVSALSALAGSAVGGLTSGMTSWMSARVQARAGRIASEISRRQELFRDFIAAASTLYADAIVSSEPKLENLVAVYAIISRMRVLCAPETVERADKIMRITVDTYLAPNKTIRQLNELIKNGTSIDPLKDFSEAAREELRSLE